MFLSDGIDGEAATPFGRRTFLIGAGAAAAALVWVYFQKRGPMQAEAAFAEQPETVAIVEFTDAGKLTGVVNVPRIVKTEAEWRKQLSGDSFVVTLESGTESPYFNENPNDHAKGVFRCICCDTALFNADTKFASGTGWPSLWAPIAKENVLETTDGSFGVERTAVACRLCNAHLGHVFPDGPPPTGLRYCMNSVAMRFAKAA
jgi:peptide-methionine (R)-S-oxide reductase